MFMTGPQSRHQPLRRCVRDHNVYDRPAIPAIWHQRRRARDATDFCECMMIHSRIESPSVLIQGMHMKVLDRVYFLQNRESVRTNTGYAYESFSKVYWDRVYFCAPSGCDKVRFSTPSGTPRPNESRVPPSPPPGGDWPSSGSYSASSWRISGHPWPWIKFDPIGPFPGQVWPRCF